MKRWSLIRRLSNKKLWFRVSGSGRLLVFGNRRCTKLLATCHVDDMFDKDGFRFIEAHR